MLLKTQVVSVRSGANFVLGTEFGGMPSELTLCHCYPAPYYYSRKPSRTAQISWHGRPARAHGQDGRATLGCGSAGLYHDGPSSSDGWLPAGSHPPAGGPPLRHESRTPSKPQEDWPPSLPLPPPRLAEGAVGERLVDRCFCSQVAGGSADAYGSSTARRHPLAGSR